MSKELEFLIKTVQEASKLITDDFIIKAKGNDGDLVTNFDLEIENYIIDRIKKEYPSYKIVSEEYNNKESLTYNCFTIDPIDGTINFVNGFPLWAVQVACVKNCETVAAVIYLPKLDELYYADNNGAFLNGKKIHVNDKNLNKGIFTICGPNNAILEYKMKRSCHNYRDTHCAAVNFAFVANGRFSATNFNWDSPWDYVPGMYIAKMAGAIIHDEEGNHIAACNKAFFDELIKNSSIDNVTIKIDE